MKKIGSVLEFISSKTICTIASIFLAVLMYWAGTSTHMTYVELENLKVRLYEDSMFLNVCCLLCILVMFGLVSKIVFTGKEETDKKRVHLFAVIVTCLAGGISIIWVSLHNYVPDHDQLQVVTDAMNFLKGNYSDLKGYLEIYPHQIGLVFLYKILFSVIPSYKAIYYFHVLWIMCIVYFTYAVSQELFENSYIAFYSIIGAVSFIPMYFFVNYAYGDLSMAACGILGIWCVIKFCKTNQMKFAVCLVAVMTFSYLARSNALVVIIAMVLTLLVYSIRKWDWKVLLVAGLLFVIPIGTQKAIVMYYEHQADVIMVSGSPAILHIAMGMQETYEGPGYYNAYNLTTYVNAEKNAKIAAGIGKDYIRNRIQEMKGNPVATKDFYILKICQQWNEPSFGGEIATKMFSEEPCELVHNIYFGEIQICLRNFRNRYLFILYAGAFCGALCRLCFAKQKKGIWEELLLVILIGGFLFSILWENKSRYVMPYVVMLIPYGVYGLYQMQIYMTKGLNMIKQRKKRSEVSEK